MFPKIIAFNPRQRTCVITGESTSNFAITSCCRQPFSSRIFYRIRLSKDTRCPCCRTPLPPLKPHLSEVEIQFTINKTKEVFSFAKARYQDPNTISSITAKLFENTQVPPQLKGTLTPTNLNEYCSYFANQKFEEFIGQLPANLSEKYLDRVYTWLTTECHITPQQAAMIENKLRSQIKAMVKTQLKPLIETQLKAAFSTKLNAIFQTFL